LNAAAVTQGGVMDMSNVSQTGASNSVTVNQNVAP